MTGFGESHNQEDGFAVAVEVRSINNRYFKLTVRASEGYAALEPLIEAEVRRTIHRGTVQVNVRVDRRRSPDDFKINADVLERYRTQLESIQQRCNPGRPVALEVILPLPGVVDDASGAAIDAAADWPIIERTLRSAMDRMSQMRNKEGQAMAADLAANCDLIGTSLDHVERRAPLVVADYRTRLHERLKKTLAEFDVTIDASDLIKEVSLFADRGDISEEIVRLRSHLEQFQATLGLSESSGRKLEFLTQEMFREANTIGSKGNDVEIARDVIDIKATIERIREMIQNIE
jgi:uncharacterized protein (TIGR00255 family)